MHSSNQAFGNNIDKRVQLTATDSKVVRVISEEWTPFYKQIWDDGTLAQLTDLELIPRTVVNSDKVQADLVFEQDRIPFISYPHEWSPAMVIDAAEACLNLHEELLQRNLCLIDSHSWNIVFDGCAPRWVDVTSISDFSPTVVKASLRQFKRAFLNPLRLLSHGHADLVANFTSHSFSSVSDEVTTSIGNYPQRHSGRISRVSTAVSKPFKLMGRQYSDYTSRRWIERLAIEKPSDASLIVQRFREQIAALSINAKNRGWSSYIQAGLEPFENAEISLKSINPARHENKKFSAISNFFDRIKNDCDSVLDIACNQGLYAQLATMFGFRSSGIDMDDGAIDSMYRSCRSIGRPLSAALNDAIAPIEAGGMVTNPLPSLCERFEADTVLCLALIHHLYFGKYQMSFQNIAGVLKKYCRKYLVIEFIPAEDVYLKENYASQSRYSKYQRQDFLDAMSASFAILDQRDSLPEGRQIYLLKKSDAS